MATKKHSSDLVSCSPVVQGETEGGAHAGRTEAAGRHQEGLRLLAGELHKISPPLFLVHDTKTGQMNTNCNKLS
jgi:hypothetical protein